MAKKIDKLILFFIVCTTLIVVSYFLIDQPLAAWIHSQHVSDHPIFLGFTYLPNFLVYSSTLLFVSILLFKSKQPHPFFLKITLSIFMSTCAAVVLVKVLKFCFGRIGPEYWIAKDFSEHAYGFYFFQGYARIFQDFPSGHSAVGFSAATIFWMNFPKNRWFSILIGFLILLGLLATNSHFLGDCIAGAFLGISLGYLTNRFIEKSFSYLTIRHTSQFTTNNAFEETSR